MLSIPSTGRSGSSARLGEQQDPPPSSLRSPGPHPDHNKSVPCYLLGGLRSDWWGLKHLTRGALLPALLSPGHVDPGGGQGLLELC